LQSFATIETQKASACSAAATWGSDIGLSLAAHASPLTTERVASMFKISSYACTLLLAIDLAACVAKPVSEHGAAQPAAAGNAAAGDARMAPQAPFDETPITPVESAGASA
jgi:hypothetical protein